MKRRFPYSKISILREGIIYILVLLITGFAAINSGNNIIYLIFSIALSIFACSSILAVRNLKGVEVEIDTPYEIYANKESNIYAYIKNADKRKKFLIDVKIETQTQRIEEINGVEKRKFKILETKRGIKTIKAIKISSAYPFNFFTREIEENVGYEYFVFPEIRKIYVNNNLIDGTGSNKKSEDGDFYSLEDYKPIMDARKIAWKISAKSNKEKAVIFADSEDSELKLVFDVANRMYTKDSFEEAVIKVASLVYKLYSSNKTFEFITNDFHFKCTNKNDYLKIMDKLAVIEQDNSASPIKEQGITPWDISLL